MRTTFFLLLFLSAGCKHCTRFVADNDDGPEIIRVKAPRQKVIVEVPEDCPEGECDNSPRAGTPVPTPRPKQAPTAGAPAPAPNQIAMMPSQPQILPGGPVMVGAPTMAGFSMPQNVPVANTEQTIRAPRTRWALGLTSINIPIPSLKLFDVPVPGEVTTTTTIPAAPPQQIQLQQQAIAPVQQYAGMTQFVQPTAGIPIYQQQPQFVGMPMIQQQPQFAGMPMIQQQPQFAGMPMIQQQPQPQPFLVAGSPAPPQPQLPPKAGAPAPADCPPVTKETLDALQRELDRARAITEKK